MFWRQPRPSARRWRDGTEPFQTVAAGAEHTCAGTAAGSLHCWGFNGFGSLGLGDNADRSVPTQVVASGGREIDAGWYHTCAEIDGVARCWGFNHRGQLGDGSFRDRPQPTAVVDIPGAITSITLGEDLTCSLGTDAVVRCWGDNTYGQLGIGVLGFAASPSPVALP